MSAGAPPPLRIAIADEVRAAMGRRRFCLEHDGFACECDDD